MAGKLQLQGRDLGLHQCNGLFSFLFCFVFEWQTTHVVQGILSTRLWGSVVELSDAVIQQADLCVRRAGGAF